MILKYDIPATLYPQLALKSNEVIHYYIPYDLDLVHNFVENSYCLVTNYRLLLLKGTTITHEYLLSEYTKFECETLIGCGIIIATKNNEEVLLLKFSMKHIIRYSYISKGLHILCQQSRKEKGFTYDLSEEQLRINIESKEPELYCKKCNHPLISSYKCQKCDSKYSTFHSVIELAKPYTKQWILITLLMMAMASISLYLPSIQKNFIDNVLTANDQSVSKILIFIGTMLGFSCLLILADITKFKTTTQIGSDLSLNLRSKVYDKLQTLSLTYINNQPPGNLMNRITSDTQEIRAFIQNTLGEMGTTLITMIGALALMLSMDVQLTLLSTMFLIIVAILNRLFYKQVNRLVHHFRTKHDTLNSSLQDVISGMRVVKSFGKEDYEIDRFYKKDDVYRTSLLKLERFWAIFHPSVNFIMGIGIYFAIYYGGLNVLEDRLTTGELIQFVAYTNTLYGPLGWISFLPRRVLYLLTSYERVAEILDQEPEIKNKTDSAAHDITGEVTFEHVHFGYKVYSPVLEDINFKITPGEMIGLVGSSGAGKSTLINLIMRLYDVDQGTIKIDGKDIRSISTESLHSQIGVVLQETFLFSGTILNNIRYAKPDATVEEIIQATKAANAHDFISLFPDGYNTYVGEKGYKLSGGERQRIAIARAILHNPKILILDEATSALDTESEYLIQQALDRLTKGRTTFAIAHRLSTLRNADRLIVIDDKRVAEIGSHNELLERQGIYYKLVTAQLEMQKIQNIQELYDIENKKL